MASGAKAVLDKFNLLSAEQLAEEGRNGIISVPQELACKEDVVKFLAWMNENLAFVKDQRAQTARIKAELDVKRSHLEKLRALHTQLSLHKMALVDKQKVKKKGEISTAVQLQKTVDDVTKTSVKFNSQLEAASQAVTAVAVHHGDSTQHEVACNEVVPFLSRLSLQPYFESESRFMAALTQYSKLHCLKDLGGIISSSDDGHTIIDLSNLQNFQVKGVSSEDRRRLLSLLRILQKLLPETKLKLISASVAEEHLKAVHSFLAKRLEEETQSDVNTALRVEVLKEREAHLRERSAGLKQELSLMHQRLPPLVHSLTHMQLTALDHRSCDLKLARQNYFLSKLDKVIEGLNDQRSRYEALSLLHQLELKQLQRTRHLLVLLRQQLTTWNKEFKERIRSLKDPSLLRSHKQKVAVHSQDYTTQAAHLLLEGAWQTPSQESNSILTYTSVSSRLKTLSDQIKAFEESIRSNKKECSQRVLKLERSLATLYGVLFTDPSGEYESSSRDLSAQICELERVLGEVEAKMRDSLHSRDMKKQMLEKDPVLKQERSLFTNFMADPDRLQNVLGQLATQVTMLATAAVSTEKS